jgi:hypothetical protein
VAPERWHLSYVPVAAGYMEQLTTGTLRDTIQATDMALGDVVLEHLDEIYQRFVININSEAA